MPLLISDLPVVPAGPEIVVTAERAPTGRDRTAASVSVIDRHLQKSGKPYLVGDRVSYADLAFVPWHMALGFLVPDWDYAKEAPHFAKWNQSLLDRPAVKKIAEEKAKASQK